MGKFPGNPKFINMKALFQKIQGVGILIFFIQNPADLQKVGGTVAAAFIFLKMGQGFREQAGGKKKLF